MTEHQRWRVRLAAAAKADLRSILRWTAQHFGEIQARIYADTLRAAMDELAEGPRVTGARDRSDIAGGLMTLHVARGGRKGRHFALYRVNTGVATPVIDVLRLLHDSMDLSRHIERDDDEDH